jgi:hypothetical protein
LHAVLVPEGGVQVTVRDADGTLLASTCGVTVTLWAADDPIDPRNSVTGCTSATGTLLVTSVIGNVKLVATVADGEHTPTWYGGTDFGSATPLAVATGTDTVATVNVARK